MLINKRSNVFETNSSSMHSISFTPVSNKTMDLEAIKKSLYINGEGKIKASFGEFGWGYDVLSSFGEKLSYVLTTIKYYDHEIDGDEPSSIAKSKYFEWLNDALKNTLGIEVEIDEDETDSGYVDHQSTDTMDDYFRDDESGFENSIMQLLLDDGYTIIIDNDNH